MVSRTRLLAGGQARQEPSIEPVWTLEAIPISSGSPSWLFKGGDVSRLAAGMVIAGAAARVPERLKLLLYLDAYVPDGGQNEFDLLPEAMCGKRSRCGGARRKADSL